jgi:hypothetical protein
LINFKDTSAVVGVERMVYIPTRAQFKGDTGFINLPALARGETVMFKPLFDTKWLLDNGWLLVGETAVPFVENFEIFLPQKSYTSGAEREFTTTTVGITSIAGSSVSPNTRVVYILPRGHNKYLNVYEEGYTSCSTLTEINNPYSLCKNLPKICDTSSRKERQSLLPTVLSTWSLRIKILKGSQVLKWDAPDPATNLLIRAKVKLWIPSDLANLKRQHVPSAFGKAGSVLSDDGCCVGNSYRISMYNNTCVSCPENSTSIHRGLYCVMD